MTPFRSNELSDNEAAVDHENILVKIFNRRRRTIGTIKNYNEDQKKLILLLVVNNDEACNLELRVIVVAGK